MAKEDFDILGYTGLKEWGGHIYEEFHRRLQGQYAAKVYREMSDNSSTIGAIRYLIKALVRQVEWRVEPSVEHDQTAAEWAAFTESCITDMSITFEDFISEVLSFLDYGWSYFEIVYKIRRGQTNDPRTRSKFDDGKIGWRKFALRAQDTLDSWEFDEEDQGLRGMNQQTELGQFAFIPIEKALLFRTETYKNNPEGRSIYRNAVVDWFFLKRIGEIEAIGIERDLTGLPVMEVPIKILRSNAGADEVALRTQFETLLSQIKRDERAFAMVPSEQDRDGKPTGYKFKLLSSGGQHQINTNETKVYYKTGILQSVVAQFLQLGMNNVGSFALASSQTNLFAIALGAFLDVITSTINRFAIARLMELNNVPTEYWPTLVHGDIESPPLAEIGAYLQALATAGQLPEDDAIKRKLLEIGGLPIPETEEGQGFRGKGKAPIRTLGPSSNNQ
jgi:hypothetical protein